MVLAFSFSAASSDPSERRFGLHLTDVRCAITASLDPWRGAVRVATHNGRANVAAASVVGGRNVDKAVLAAAVDAAFPAEDVLDFTTADLDLQHAEGHQVGYH